MANGDSETKPPLSIQEVAAAVRAIDAEEGLKAMATRVLSYIQAWASPTLVFCVARDPVAEAGWRVVPELGLGQTPPGFERFMAKLIEEAPAGTLTQPTPVRLAAEDVPGLRIRDSWILPWRHGAALGYLLIRGIARPYPPNLGDAIALAAEPVWAAVAATGFGVSPAVPAGERLGRLEGALGHVRQLVERIEGEIRSEQQRQQAGPAAAAAPAGRDPALDEALRDLAALRHEREHVQARIDALERRSAEAEAQRGFARGEAAGLKMRVEELDRELQKEKARGADAVEEARAEWAKTPTPPNDEQRRELEQVRRELEQARREAEEARRGHDETKGRAAALEEKLDATERAHRATSEARAEAAAQATAARDRGDALEVALAAAENAKGVAEGARAKLEAERAALEAERDRGRTQLNQVWASLESLQKETQGDKERTQAERTGLDDARKRAIEEREEAVAASQGALERARESEEQARALQERWDKTVGAFREALVALQRTPFVPPNLRISVVDAERLLNPEGAARRTTPRPRVLLLDRDTASLGPLAGDLEAAGIEALIAHYPEEVTFFLKTPESRGLTSLVCDVMAFRPDQNLMDLFKAWRQDVPGLAFLLSFRADNPSEAEKAQRIPVTLAAGYLPRPLQRESLVEAVGAIARRQGLPVARPAERKQDSPPRA
jgi:hypothetical protein